MKTRIIHHTPYEFPIDTKFYGQTFYIGNHTKNSSLETAVSSLYTKKRNEREENRIQMPGEITLLMDDEDQSEKIARERFRTKLLFGGAHQWLVSSQEIGDLSQTRNHFSDPNENYLDTLDSWAQDGRVVMGIHYFRSGYQKFEKLKKIYGNNIDFYLHLHCLADLFLGNLNKQELSRGQLKHRDDLHQMIDSVNPKFIAVSDAVRDSFQRHGIIPEGSIKVIHGGVSTDLYRPVSEKAKEEFKRDLGIRASKLVGYCGRLDQCKGVDTLFEILRHYERNHSDVGFLITASNGEKMGEFLDKVEKFVPRLVSDGKLKFCLDVSKLTAGFYTKDEFVNSSYYQKIVNSGLRGKEFFADIITRPVHPNLDIYLHPANSEALSLSILEALMSGVPVVASNVGGIPEIVNMNNGTLVDVKKEAYKPKTIVTDFVSAIDYWLNHTPTQDYMAKTRDNLIRAGFDDKTMTNKLDEFYLLS